MAVALTLAWDGLSSIHGDSMLGKKMRRKNNFNLCIYVLI